jgi:hypothetical protein
MIGGLRYLYIVHFSLLPNTCYVRNLTQHVSSKGCTQGVVLNEIVSEGQPLGETASEVLPQTGILFRRLLIMFT